MEIDDTIQTLTGVRQSIGTWAPKTTTRPDVLIADLNDLYVAAAENRDFNELFEFDDVGSPSITLSVSIEVDFDLDRVMENLRARLHLLQPDRADEIGKAGIVWSHGRYDFVYDEDSGTLRVSHRYSHRRVYTKAVSSIAKQMIDYAIDYLEEIKASGKENTDTPEAKWSAPSRRENSRRQVFSPVLGLQDREALTPLSVTECTPCDCI